MPAFRPFPAPGVSHPVPMPDGSVHEGTVFLSAVIDHPRFEVGYYTYASAHHPPEDWAAYLAPYLYPFSPEKLTIGRFCQIASGVEFITASANHRYDGISTFPFAVFGGGPVEGRPSMPSPGADTCVGHDVWIGTGARILPGARIGSGAIIGAGAVVSGEVAPYTIVAGNPARPVRRRFAPETIERLLEIAWWEWPIDRILAHEAAICGGDLSALEHAARH
ncbi:CatB-related O-acetyltransferase [Roseibacterium beibuensis]|uniref:CatB-related O-acetyltransferase n=1 Tax=[Roseibacterium] beibuensis TaxID=1193142 RepID=A0ABP9L9L5_9RHOB|nr:CatB-related O-acetyltransferase [Roseibacterium beibuensis]MCS6627864.1 CatB-related O-acetyltransferase [Roseibacterium beibuensis]